LIIAQAVSIQPANVATEPKRVSGTQRDVRSRIVADFRLPAES